MTYNEYAQVLEAENPDTGELYQPEDMNVIDYNEVGTAMLQDAIFARAGWLAEEGNEDVATRFLTASFQGWIHCLDNFDECVEVVLNNGSTLGESHQQWQLNEINGLIWPSPAGIGMLDEMLWDQTVAVAIEGEVIAELNLGGGHVGLQSLQVGVSRHEFHAIEVAGDHRVDGVPAGTPLSAVLQAGVQQQLGTTLADQAVSTEIEMPAQLIVVVAASDLRQAFDAAAFKRLGRLFR